MSAPKDDSKQLQKWLASAEIFSFPWRPLLLWDRHYPPTLEWSDGLYEAYKERYGFSLRAGYNDMLAVKRVLTYTTQTAVMRYVLSLEPWEPEDDVQRRP